MEITGNINRNIRVWRLLKELKQEQLAKELGITKAALSFLENGKTKLTLSRMQQICKALDISEEIFLFIDPATFLKTYELSRESCNSQIMTPFAHSQKQLLTAPDLVQDTKTPGCKGSRLSTSRQDFAID